MVGNKIFSKELLHLFTCNVSPLLYLQYHRWVIATETALYRSLTRFPFSSLENNLVPAALHCLSFFPRKMFYFWKLKIMNCENISKNPPFPMVLFSIFSVTVNFWCDSSKQQCPEITNFSVHLYTIQEWYCGISQQSATSCLRLGSSLSPTHAY